jgi:hypothetical protein
MLDSVSRSQQPSSSKGQHRNVLIAVRRDDCDHDCSSLCAPAGSATGWLVSETISSRYSVVVSETQQSLKSVPAITAQELASVRESMYSPRDQIARPQNAILSKFESPHRSCGRRHPTVSRGVAQPGRAPGSGHGGNSLIRRRLASEIHIKAASG